MPTLTEEQISRARAKLTKARKRKRNDGVYFQKNPNFRILRGADKIGWKVARKVKGMIARVLDRDCVVSSIEGPLNAKAGQVVCRGIDSNDWWVQKKDKMLKKYNLKGKFPQKVLFNGVEYSDFEVFSPKPDRAVLCCKMPYNFKVVASWGLLKGKKGDFLVKPLEDEFNPNPQDVWLVDHKLFNATYKIHGFLGWF